MNDIQIHFAPLQGYTDAVYRKAHASVFGGVDAYYTPFVRIDNGVVRSKELRDISRVNNLPHCVVPQLIASSVDEFTCLASLFKEEGYTRADINLGCPFPKQTRLNRGSKLLALPEQTFEMLTLVKDFSSISFSVKMRIGWDDSSQFEKILPFLNELPLSHITLHPRLGTQQYKGEPDMSAFEQFYHACNHPLYYNGDIDNLDICAEIIDRFPLIAGIMIGRGLLSYPWMAVEYKSGKKIEQGERRKMLIDFHELLYEGYANQLEGGDHQLLSKLKTIWDYFLPDSEKKMRKKVIKSTSLNNYRLSVSSLLADY
nr:tRNA-dihydrouridine synthase family protein [uncultured Macellibacteroides sp.]